MKPKKRSFTSAKSPDPMCIAATVKPPRVGHPAIPARADSAVEINKMEYLSIFGLPNDYLIRTMSYGSLSHRKQGGIDEIHLRSEEHTSELQSLRHLVCRLLL